MRRNTTTGLNDMASERNAPGYLGTTIILPGGGRSTLRYIINRFTDKAHMVAWESSQDAQNLLDEVNHYSTRYYEKDYWFRNFGSVCQTWRELYSLLLDGKWLLSYSLRRMRFTSISRFILNPFLGHWHILANTAIYSGVPSGYADLFCNALTD